MNVCPTRDHEKFGEYSGAFVNVYALAPDEPECRALVLGTLADDHLQVIDWEEDPTLFKTSDLESADAEFSEDARSALENLSLEWPVQYGNFHTYPKDGLDA